MTTKNKLITALILSNSTIIVTDLINKYIKFSATSKNVLENSHSCCYHWRLGNIHYTKIGSGKPLLLIHDLNAASSSYQWNSIIPALSKEYTVYAIDLLGCGRSEKPNITYTNFLYVQLISDFIKSEIGHRTDAIVVGNSGSFVITACNNTPELFNRIMLVNPDSLSSCSKLPGKYAKLYKSFLDFPVIGTLLCNIATSKKALRETFISQYFYNPYSVREFYIDAYHESSHLGRSPKSVYSSIHCRYTNCNIINALKKIDNSIYLIGGECMEHERELLQEYVNQNSSIEYILISETKFLPHLEKPTEFLSAVRIFFS